LSKEKELSFFETSAKTCKGIKEGFDYTVNTSYEKKKKILELK